MSSLNSNYGTIHQPSSSGSSSFSPTEFLILKESISNNIIVIKKQYHKLEKIQKIIGSKNDTNELRAKIQSIQKNAHDVIKSTSFDIKKLNSIVKFSSTEKTHQLVLEKIASEFHAIVQKYLQSEKSLSLKLKKTLLVNINNDDSDDEDVTASIQQKQLTQANYNFEKELLVEREEQFQKIETNVIDINQIMSEISTLIHEQGENIQTIDNSISHVAEDIEGGVSELQKAANHQQKFRRKVLIIALIALIVAIFVVFSLYSKLKK
ncbi:CLUMA_CG014881, isoform A [Clunio marinus]|uniref:CLUMA_CG014881, isoform A n=1 Tax=Clunio marinus TaxID=568069 RepID=A0A1J1IN62_9DIPT|nr:CLUMA_CG014881, isoform A [Clunio marinus]